MSGQELSPRELRLAQRRFTFFTALNVISFQLLSGNIITLFALRLGAGNFLIGALYSFVPLAQVMPLVGRAIVARIGAVKTLSRFWFLRYVLMTPILLAPLMAALDRASVGIALIIVSVIGFNLARGIGITGHNPVVAGITSERDRGSFLARNQIVVHSGSILTGVAMAALLGAVSTLVIYTVLIATGIAAGVAAAIVVGRLPEPPQVSAGGRMGLIEGLRSAIAGGGVRRFLGVLALKSFVISMAIPFLVVFLKRVYEQADSSVVYFTVIGSVGAISMALISGLAIDSTGPKPVSQVFGAILLVALVLVAVAPTFTSPVLFWLFAGALFFLANMGANGLENGLSNYFFRLIRPDQVLNVGIVNFLVAGAAATIGSLAGGAILDALEGTTLAAGDAFRVYYAGLIVILLLLLVVVTTLRRLGPAYTARDVMAMFLSPRDLHAMSLLRRLRTSDTRRPEKDEQFIRALGQTRSSLSTSQLLSELKSPRFSVRFEALNALAAGTPSTEVTAALIEQVQTQEFTTAYRAAEVLGRSGVMEAIPALREALDSDDYLLCGKSMVALSQLDDSESASKIERLVAATHNPRLIILGATALENLGSPSSVGILIAKLTESLSGFVRDEVNMAIAGILGFQDAYYSLYLTFIDDKKRGVAALKDYLAENLAKGGDPSSDPETLRSLADATLGNEVEFVQLFVEAVKGAHLVVASTDVVPLLVEAAQNPALSELSRFRYLLSCVAIHSALE